MGRPPAVQGVQPCEVSSAIGTLYRIPCSGTGVGDGLGVEEGVEVRELVGGAVGVGVTDGLTVGDTEGVLETEEVTEMVEEKLGVALGVGCQQLATEVEPVLLVICPAEQFVHTEAPVVPE